MIEIQSTAQNCACGKQHAAVNIPLVNDNVKPLKHFMNTARSLFSFLLSFLIAFFPKCPVCWAVYMSMFGGLGLVQLPYLKWMLPILLLLFAVNLFLLFLKGKKAGYGPFWLTLAGAGIILIGRNFFIADKELLYAGMFMVLCGSVWSSFSQIRFKIATHTAA